MQIAPEIAAMLAGTGASSDPVAPVLIALVLIAAGAALGGHWMKKLGQPAVLGELLVGMLAANLAYYFREPAITIVREGPTMLNVIHAALEQNLSLAEAAAKLLPAGEHTRQLVEILGSAAAPMAVSVFLFVDQLARVAVIILLFLVGLETSVKEMRRVGVAALAVACIGVVVPFLLGVRFMAVMMPGAPLEKDIFIGAILTATSVGITARVFRDLKQAHRTEAKIILGAAVIDDVLGLMILAVVSGLVVTGTVSVVSISTITLKALVFLAGAIGVGMWVTPRLVRRLARLELENVKLLFGLGFAFLLAWLANAVGLATIVGAFAAGLVLEEFFLDELKGHSLRDLLSPLETLVVPVFFVLMGMQVKLETFADARVVAIAALLTVAAIAGKLVAGLGCSPKLDRLSVGIGMMPRGEVGLIFASIGKGLGVVSDAVFSAVVIMVMVTTLLTPPLLKMALARGDRRAT
ncbi:MAG: cation:proton antiporter [Acidobacteria bacterium]|nr:cation:proton antiporter [Acidobacteriota bacterium]